MKTGKCPKFPVSGCQVQVPEWFRSLRKKQCKVSVWSLKPFKQPVPFISFLMKEGWREGLNLFITHLISKTLLKSILSANFRMLETFHSYNFFSSPYSNCRKFVWWNFSFSLSFSLKLQDIRYVMCNALPSLKPQGDPKLKFKANIVMGCIQSELNKCWQIIGQKVNKMSLVSVSPMSVMLLREKTWLKHQANQVTEKMTQIRNICYF